jgi:glycosyltransferase involved in cell wall biosynthesis
LKRVLVVIPSLERGGAETYVARTSPLLREHGIEVEVCALEPSGSLGAELTAAGVTVHGTPYPQRYTRSNTAVLAATIADIRHLLVSGRFDILHTYLYWPDVLGVPAGRLAGRRVIISRRALHAWRHETSALLHTLEAAANLLAGELIANSKEVLRDTVASERFLPKRRTVIYNGIETGRYRAGKPSTKGRLRILTVGALSARKGQEFAIQAVAEVAPEVDLSLRLVGAGPDEPMLREQSRRLGVDDRVEFAGEIADPRPDLTTADLFLLPSRQEGFSNALLEAMASGLPVIATDVGGNAEALVDGEGGMIVPPEDPAAIAAAIRTLAGHRGHLAAMGEANRERVRRLFSLEASVAALAAWYESGDR